MIWQARFEGDYAVGYDDYGRSLGAEKRNRADAAGSMVTTIGDFARFMRAVMEGRLLRGKTREQMFSPQVPILSKHEFPTLIDETTDENKAIRLSYGLAWGLYWTPYGKAFFKEGHDTGWRNYTVCLDRQKTGIAIMTNSGNGEGIFKDLLEMLLKDTFTPIEWEGYTPYDKLPPRQPLEQHQRVSVDTEVLDRYVGRYPIPPNIVLVIRREGDHLSVQESVQGNDEAKQDLLPETETQFFSTAADDVYRFETDREGHPTAVVLHTDGKDITIERMK
jgi:CubicO group peptidase (beta-lactamase class C family)